MLGVLASAPGYTNNYQNRLNAMSLLSKFLSSPVMGDEASTSLRRSHYHYHYHSREHMHYYLYDDSI